jgi:3-keto-disaccharide hydrolase
MERRGFLISLVASAAALLTAPNVAGQKKTVSPDLAKLAEGNGLKHFNRTASSLNDGVRKGARLSEGAGEGPAYLEGIEFADGTIELDVRGKDVQQQSFVGVAFHGVDGATYEAIYFRPFNFRAEDPARRLRAVQYISHPTYTWQKLRAEHPGRYEQPVSPVPDPNGWFHVRVVVASPKVSVFVNDAKEPSLVVNQLSDRKKGLVGLWVGNGSGGDFANLTIVTA